MEANSDLIYRLRERARIRRQIPGRKSAEEGKPDRIADLLDEAAVALETIRERCASVVDECNRRELEQLTSAIQQMASRVNAQFVVDVEKTRNFAAAEAQREVAKKMA